MSNSNLVSNQYIKELPMEQAKRNYGFWAFQLKIEFDPKNQNLSSLLDP